MPRVRRLAAGLVLVVLTGCGQASDLVMSEPSEPTKSEPTTKPTKRPEVAAAPKVGACRVLTLADVPPPTNDDPEVPCGKPHTAVTYHVTEWPQRLTKSAKSVNDSRLTEYAVNECDRQWVRTVGGSQEAWEISIVSWAWFKATAAEFEAGAHWFRCDVVAGQETDRLEELPPSVDGLLDGSFSDRYQACWTKEFSNKPNTDEGEVTSCARKHRQRAIGIVIVGKAGEKYPGQNAVFDESNDLCGKAVSKWRGKKRKAGEFGLQWPTRDEWNGGERYATCWAVTRQ